MNNLQEKTNKETTNQNQGFIANPQVFLGRDGETLVHRLPGGSMKIELHVNLYKKILGITFTPKAQTAEKTSGATRPAVYGFTARPDLYLSRSGEYLIHSVLGLRISKHVNFYKKILGAEFEPKASQATQARTA